ncbi:NAD(P)H-quinone oxidoreductase subunit T, chloroplastic-like [Nymphaea colorata]|nr:NAD(P)H-quinone oxidoreductase subunit T, chloroplastic-like [Nymphaea colorata]
MATTAPTFLPTFLRSSKSAVPRSRRAGVFAIGSSVDANRRRKERAAGVDTRIHWDSPDEGWVGGKSSSSFGSVFDADKEENFGENLPDIIKNATGTHYEFLGVSAEADMEEIKAAYRRLSKEYHPDTTLLPLKAASDKFVRLRKAYDVLSDEKRRRFYDRDLVEEAASRQAERMRLRLEDPYEQDVRNWEPVPDMVDRLGGKNMELSDQTLTALTFDIVAVIVSVCCIAYALFFKEAS